VGSASKPSTGHLKAAHQQALELVADRWNMWLLVAVDEDTGSRFSDLAAEPGLSRRVLTERLDRLVDAQLLRREQYSARPVRHLYALTERGLAVRRVSVALLHVAAGGRLPGLEGARTEGVPSASAQAAPRGEAAAPTAAAVSVSIAPVHPSDQLLEGDPAAARAIYEAAVAPIVRYDDQYRTPLVETLEVYLECDASVSVTAARLYAHRHTVRYRLGRVRELTGLDVDSLADRERLVLGLRALRQLRRRGEELT